MNRLSAPLPPTIATLLALVLAGAVSGVQAQETQETRPPQVRSRGQAAQRSNRDAWEKLPSTRRRALKRLHARLRELPPGQREKLRSRLRAMSPEERRVALRRVKQKLNQRRDKNASKHNTDVDRIQRHARRLRQELLEELAPQERRRLRNLPKAERREYVKKLLSRLPPRARDRIAQLPPRKQAGALLRFRAAQAARRTFPKREEITRLRELPRRELSNALGFDAEGRPLRPAFVSPESWERWLNLKPRERLRVLRFLAARRDHQEGMRVSPQVISDHEQ